MIIKLPFINHLLCVLSNTLGYLFPLFYLFCAVTFSGTSYCLHVADEENRSLRCNGSPGAGSDSPCSLWAGQIILLPPYAQFM